MPTELLNTCMASYTIVWHQCMKFIMIIANVVHYPDLLPITSTTKGHNQQFHYLFARTSQYGNSFFPRAIRLWNSLPPHLIQQQSLITFKNQSKLLCSCTQYECTYSVCSYTCTCAFILSF